jgi:nicotinamide-nucleotide amidase
LAGIAESQFADQVGERMNRNALPRIGVTAQSGLLRVTVRASCATPEAAQELTERTLAELRRQFGDSAFEHGPDGLAGHVIGLLRANRSSLATAESITGGGIAKLLTDVSGASAVFREGFVAYSAAAKIARLGVPPALIEREGAVSAACAAAMAEGARRASEADFGLSATGVAGPELDERGTAVGTVWLGLATPRGVETRQLVSMGSDRATRRLHAAHAALDFLRRALPKAP